MKYDFGLTRHRFGKFNGKKNFDLEKRPRYVITFKNPKADKKLGVGKKCVVSQIIIQDKIFITRDVSREILWLNYSFEFI